MPTTDQLATQLLALDAKVDQLIAVVKKMRRPDVRPVWETRRCQVCGEPATVIDLDDVTLDTSRNGEGYCLAHATANGILNGDHLTKS